MNTQRFIAAAALAFTAATAGTAFAAETAFVQQPVSTLSRAEVQAELVRARAAGEVNQVGEGYSLFRINEATSSTTRAEVLAELARARANGEVQQAGEAYALFPQRKRDAATATASVRTREEVRAEARRATRTRSFDVSYIGG